jgi:hypothetical protein
MKKLILTTIIIMAFAGNSHANCLDVPPMKPVSLCNGQWQLICNNGGYYGGHWMWICTSNGW